MADTDTDNQASPRDFLRADLNDLVFEKTQWEGRSVDWMLQWMVDFIVRTNLSIGITLSVGGAVISGKLIAHRQYFEAIADELSRSFAVVGPEASQAMKSTIMSFSRVEHAGEEEPPPQYLHLADAKIYTGSGTPVVGQGTYWRGKISSVEGFTFGEIRNQN